MVDSAVFLYFAISTFKHLAACGGGLYFMASYTTALMLVLLRFGPRVLEHSESIILPLQENVKPKSRVNPFMSYR